MASPVSAGGARASPRSGAAESPSHIRAAARVHARSMSRSSERRSVMTSKAAKCSLSCAAVAMPAWLWPKKAIGCCAVGASTALASGSRSREST